MYIRMNGKRENVIQTIVIHIFFRWCFDSYLTLEKDRRSFIHLGHSLLIFSEIYKCSGTQYILKYETSKAI